MRNMSRLFPLKPVISPVPRSVQPRAAAQRRQHWRDARRFQMEVQRALGKHASFFEWLLLESLQELLDENGDAVRQVDIATRSGLSKMMTSYWMTSMEEHGLVDRAPSFDGRAYRVIISQRGEEMLTIFNIRLEGAGLLD